MKLNSVLFVLFLLLSNISCKKDITDQDEYMVCNINGAQIDFSPTKKGISITPGASINSEALFENNNKEFQINARTPDYNKRIDILVDDPAKAITSGTYKLTINLSGKNFMIYKDNKIGNLYKYATDSINTGTLVLQIDHDNQHVNGTFSADLKFELYSEVVHITEGIFSLPYRTR